MPIVPPVQSTTLATTQATTLVSPAAQVQTAPQTNANHLHFQNGILELPRYNRITLSANERARLMSLNTERRDADGNIIRDNNGNPVMVPVREGMNVFNGQVLANFDDRELQSILKINQAQLEVAKAERDKEIERIFAAHGVLVAMNELQAMVEANRQHDRIFPAVEMERQRLAVAQAEAQLELQTYTIDEVRTREVLVRESEMERTQTQIDLRKLVAPIGGTIVKVHAAEGEWLREGDPVLEIMNLETMWVMVRVPADRYSTSDVYGKQATIQVTLANGRTEMFQGVVVFCDPTIAGDRAFPAYIEIQNRRDGNHWLLQPGRDRVDIVIPL